MRERQRRAPERDMAPSGIAKVLEIFFGGNPLVEAAVLFDSTGETVDYHAHIDAFDARLLAAYAGIVFTSTQYKMTWLEDATVTMVEMFTDRIDIVTVPLMEEFCLVVSIAAGAADENFLDTVAGSVEALCQEIG